MTKLLELCWWCKTRRYLNYYRLCKRCNNRLEEAIIIYKNEPRFKKAEGKLIQVDSAEDKKKKGKKK